MVGSYLGTLIAFIFAATAPGRRLPLLVSTEPATVAFAAVLILATVTAFFVSLKGTVRRKSRPVTVRPLA